MNKSKLFVAGLMLISGLSFGQKNKPKSTDTSAPKVSLSTPKEIDWAKDGRFIQDVIADVQLNEANQSIGYIAQGQFIVEKLDTRERVKHISLAFNASRFRWLSNDVIVYWGDDYISNSAKLIIHNISSQAQKEVVSTSLGMIQVSMNQPQLAQGVFFLQYKVQNTLMFVSIAANMTIDELASVENQQCTFIPTAKKGVFYKVSTRENETRVETFQANEKTSEKSLPFLDQSTALGYIPTESELTAIGKVKNLYPSLVSLNPEGVGVIASTETGVLTDVVFNSSGAPQLAILKNRGTQFVACKPELADLAQQLNDRFSAMSMELKWHDSALTKFIFKMSGNSELAGYILLNLQNGDIVSLFDQLTYLEPTPLRLSELTLEMSNAKLNLIKLSSAESDGGKKPLVLFIDGGLQSSGIAAYNPMVLELINNGFDVVRASFTDAFMDTREILSNKGIDLLHQSEKRFVALIDAVSKATSTPNNQIVVFATGLSATAVASSLPTIKGKIAACALVNPSPTEGMANFQENDASSNFGTLGVKLFDSYGFESYTQGMFDPSVKTYVASLVRPGTYGTEQINLCVDAIQPNENVEKLDYNESFAKGYQTIKKELVEQLIKRLKGNL